MSAAVELLQQIVRIPSVSGDEAACRDRLLAFFAEHHIPARAHGRNVVAVVEGTLAAPAQRGLLLLTHIDVVPVGPGWTREPFDGALENGRVYGRGANDAKASVAAMAVAATRLRREEMAGRLVVALVCDEETGGQGIEACRADLPEFDASVVGEPTSLDVCPGQRGLFRARLDVPGRQAHASRPWEGDNAIRNAGRVLAAMERLDLGPDDPFLGPATLEPTVIAGGTKPNVLPGSCAIELDGRPSTTFDNAAMERLVRSLPGVTAVVRSNRFQPVRTPEDAPLVQVAKRARPTARVRPFGGVSDLFHVREVPGLVMGPGTSEQSHAPDESVAVEQVEAAVGVYERIARAWLAPGQGG